MYMKIHQKITQTQRQVVHGQGTVVPKHIKKKKENSKFPITFIQYFIRVFYLN